MPPTPVVRRPAPLRRAAVALIVAPIVALVAALAAAQPAEAPPDPPSAAGASRCGGGPPAAEAGGFVPLPRGDVFCPLVADPKGLRSFVSYQRGEAERFATNIASVGIADEFGLVRVGGRAPGDGVQLSLSGGVFAQFDLDAASYDLLNADYLIGLALTQRRGGFSARLRVYHQSSHLGDEFLLRDEPPERENLSFESVELLVSQELGALRAYGGGEWFVNRAPATLPRALGHAGIELRPRPSLTLGTAGRVRLLAAGDVKVVDDRGARPGVAVRAGIEVGRSRDVGVPERRWSLLWELYDGPSPYGQFHRDDVRLLGVGFHFAR